MCLISLNRRSSCQWSRVLQTCAGLSLPWVQMLGVNPPNIFSPEHVKCCVALSLCHLRQERMASGEQNLAGESAAVRLAKQHFWCQNVPTYSMDFPWISMKAAGFNLCPHFPAHGEMLGSGLQPDRWVPDDICWVWAFKILQPFQHPTVSEARPLDYR